MRRPAGLAALAAVGLYAPLGAQAAPDRCPHRAAAAVQEVLLTNLVVNRFDAWVMKADWAHTSFESWARNIRLGWEWDENAFATNMFGHPNHGAQYFNAGRANCLSYWASVPLAFLGSWTWEYFGETYRPAFNDFLMTSFGGLALGEMTHRVANTLRDTEAHGTSRVLGELGALLVNPVDGLNRLFRGQWWQHAPNPAEHDPGAFQLRVNAGIRTVREDSTAVTNTAPTFLVTLNYGDLFDRPYHQPFDVFSVRLQVSPGGGGVNALQAEGRLFQLGLPHLGGTRHALVVTQRYDYTHNPAYSFGAQSVTVGLASRFGLGRGYTLRGRFGADALILGALDAPYSGIGERTYDFGPGGGLLLELFLERRGQTLIAMYNRGEYLHSVSGAPADHLLALSGLEANLPLGRGLGIGMWLSGDARSSKYSTLPDNSRQFLESRFFFSWTSARPGGGSEQP